MSDTPHSPLEIVWFKRSAEQTHHLTKLCHEWQSGEGFWTQDQVLKALDQTGVKALCAYDPQGMRVFLLFQVAPGFSELLYLYVPQAFRGNGFAQQAMARYEDYLRSIPDCGSIFLEVRESNTTAQKLYEKLGFRRFGLRKSYYSNSENALTYRKDL